MNLFKVCWLTVQRQGTFKFLPSPWKEEFEFPTSSAPSSIRDILQMSLDAVRSIDPCIGGFSLLSHT